MDNVIDLCRQVLCCPDCAAELDPALSCSHCGRSLAPEADGIISALPVSMRVKPQSKEEIQADIDAHGASDDKVISFEKAFHDEQASYYDNIFADPLPLREYYKRLVRRQIYSFVRQEPFVVDLCCGTGKSSMPLIERGVRVIGVDVSREMLRAYRRKVSNPDKSLILVHADASHPPLRPKSCGAITMIGGLHHIPDRAGSLAHCCQSLAAGGMLIVHEPLKSGLTSRVAVLLEDLYAAATPSRAWKALKRRLGMNSNLANTAPQVSDFTPYERPFTSLSELLDMLPKGMRAAVSRSQGFVSFHEFPAYLHGHTGVPFAKLVVQLDDFLSSRRNAGSAGDALFAVLEKNRD